MRITPDLFGAYLKCPTKCFLLAHGEAPTGNTYAEWIQNQGESYHSACVAHLKVNVPHEEWAGSMPDPPDLKAAKWCLAVSFQAHTQNLESRLHALERVPSESRGKPAQFVPIRFIFTNKLCRNDKLMVTFDALVLSEMLGCAVSSGKIIHGYDHARLKVKTSGLVGEVRKRTGQIAGLLSGDSPPDLVLNRGCAECEFQGRCRQKAIERDDLSLLAGMTEKERNRQRNKGIFTVTQLSYTFRPRRAPKRAKNPAQPHHFALQALAIRENAVFIHGCPQLPDSKNQVYMDIEGLPDSNSYYLIGLLIVSNGRETFHSLWAENSSDEVSIFSKMGEILGSIPDFRVYHFGAYDNLALKSIKSRLHPRLQLDLDTILTKSVNVLSLVHPHIYFPTPSNSLKDIAKVLGGDWTSQDAGGLQSVVWRRTWEADKNPLTKADLILYNKEDCFNLKRLCDFIWHSNNAGTVKVSSTGEMRKEEPRRHRFGSKKCIIEDLQYVTKCAYFDYQRAKVFFRTHPHLKAASNKQSKSKSVQPHPNKVVHRDAERCPRCRTKRIEPSREFSYSVLDLRFSKGHVKKWITQYTYWDYYCQRCHRRFNPVGGIQHTEKYGLGLMSWCVYCNVIRGQNMLQMNKTLLDAFDISLQAAVPYRFKGYIADNFRELYGAILKSILKSPVLHIDETIVNLRHNLTGYVWVVTSMDMVYYFYKPSREGSFLEEMLRPFSGVLVSDFFTAYDSLPCQQQKCLLHLVRDMDDDLLRNPFDMELKSVTQEFGSLLRTVIETVDRYGLRRFHLHKHKPAVLRFLKRVHSMEFSSELANNYKRRFQKSGARMFTFLNYDGVPWNNTNAEHAIKLFAKYRRNADGRFTEQSLKEYLVLASVFETCEFNNVNVLKFLLSGEKTLDELFRMAGRKTTGIRRVVDETKRPIERGNC